MKSGAEGGMYLQLVGKNKELLVRNVMVREPG